MKPLPPNGLSAPADALEAVAAGASATCACAADAATSRVTNNMSPGLELAEHSRFMVGRGARAAMSDRSPDIKASSSLVRSSLLGSGLLAVPAGGVALLKKLNCGLGALCWHGHQRKFATYTDSAAITRFRPISMLDASSTSQPMHGGVKPELQLTQCRQSIMQLAEVNDGSVITYQFVHAIAAMIFSMHHGMLVCIMPHARNTRRVFNECVTGTLIIY